MSVSTTQLKEEQKHMLQFEKFIQTIGCSSKCIWGSGARNKNENCDADYTIIIQDLELFKTKIPNYNKNWTMNTELSVSLKTKGGNFTLANGGTNLKSGVFQLMELNQEEKEAFRDCHAEIRHIKNELGINKRWSDVGNDAKEPIKELLIILLFSLFQVPMHIDALYIWINERQSDLKYVGENLYLKKKFTPPPYDLAIVDIISMDTLRVGDFTLRVKSEGGSINSGWKINYGVV